MIETDTPSLEYTPRCIEHILLCTHRSVRTRASADTGYGSIRSRRLTRSRVDSCVALHTPSRNLKEWKTD